MQIGIDFGGTKIEAAALSPDGAFLARIREPNPGAYDAAIQTIGRLIAQVEAQVRASGGVAPGGRAPVGMSMPGSVSPATGVMRNANSTWLNGHPFREDLESRLDRPFRLANDANCLALSEARDGAGEGADVVYGVIIGTGCGGGLTVGGRLIEGRGGVAAEIGHIGLPWARADEAPGPACWCGLHGCLETWISGTAFQQDHARVSGHTLKAPEIIRAALDGDADALASLDRYTDRLARALAMLVNTLEPDVIVLGGGMSNVTSLYADLPGRIDRYVFADHWDGRVVPARWGDSSGVRGAARLWEPTQDIQP